MTMSQRANGLELDGFRQDPFIWVVILNWNNWELTVRSLSGLARSRWSRLGICVCDNGSTDGSIEKIIEWVRAGALWSDTGCQSIDEVFKEIKARALVIEEDTPSEADAIPIRFIKNGRNLGFSAGNNPGLKMAFDTGGKYTWLLNNDALPHPDSLASMVTIAQNDDGVGIVGGVIRDLDEAQRVQSWGGGKVDVWTGVASVLKQPHFMGKRDYICGANMLVRCAVFSDVGFLDENMFLYWDDSDLSFRTIKAGWRLAVSEDAVVWHELSATTGKKSAKRDYWMNRSAILFFSKFSPLPIVPITISFAGRIVKRIFRADWWGVWALVSAAVNVSPRDEWHDRDE